MRPLLVNGCTRGRFSSFLDRLFGAGWLRGRRVFEDLPVRHQTLGQSLQGLAERRGGAGEVVHGRGIESSVSGHFDRFVILTGGQEQLLNWLGLSASRPPENRTLVTARERRDSESRAGFGVLERRAPALGGGSHLLARTWSSEVVVR